MNSRLLPLKVLIKAYPIVPIRGHLLDGFLKYKRPVVSKLTSLKEIGAASDNWPCLSNNY